MLGNDSKWGLFFTIALIIICPLKLMMGSILLWFSQFFDPNLPAFLLWFLRLQALVLIGGGLFLPFSCVLFYADLEQRQIIKHKLFFYRWTFKQEKISLDRYNAVTTKKYFGKTFIVLISENHKPLPLYAMRRYNQIDSELRKISALLSLPCT